MKTVKNKNISRKRKKSRIREKAEESKESNEQ